MEQAVARAPGSPWPAPIALGGIISIGLPATPGSWPGTPAGLPGASGRRRGGTPPGPSGRPGARPPAGGTLSLVRSSTSLYTVPARRRLQPQARFAGLHDPGEPNLTSSGKLHRHAQALSLFSPLHEMGDFLPRRIRLSLQAFRATQYRRGRQRRAAPAVDTPLSVRLFTRAGHRSPGRDTADDHGAG